MINDRVNVASVRVIPSDFINAPLQEVIESTAIMMAVINNIFFTKELMLST